MSTHTGKCVCGAVQFEVQGSPNFSGYCHCNQCRHALSAEKPFVTVFGDVKFTKGEDKITHYLITPTSDRGFCSVCGTRLFNHITDKFWVVYPSAFEFGHNEAEDAGTLPDDWKPKAHIYYNSRLKGHDLDDGLPKIAGRPASLGGKDELVDHHGKPLQAAA